MLREPSPERESCIGVGPPSLSPTPPAQTFSLAEPLVFGPEPRPVHPTFGPAPRPAGDVDPDVIESIIFGPQPRPHGYVDPDFVEPIIFGPQPRPDNYLEPEDLDNLLSMEDDTTHGGFHVESPVRPDDAPTPTADAAGRAEDPVLLTSLSEKLDRCMGRIDSLETELGTTKKIMGGAILTLVSRVKKLEKTVKQLRTTRLVGDVPAAEGDVDIQDDVDLDGLSRMASAALGHDQPAVPSEDVEEREEEEVPLRRKRSAYRRARTEFSTPAFEQFQANLSAGGLPHTAVSESAGPSVAADKGKAPMPDLDIPAEFLAEDAQARKRFEEEQASERLVQQLQAEDLAQEDLPIVSEQRAKELDELMMRMTETDWLNLMMQVGSNPTLARELLGADVTEDNFIEHMTTIKEKKKRALADLRYRALKGKPMKQSKPAITEPPSKRQRVERASSQPASVPAATTHTADDPDSAGGGTSNPAGSAFGAPVSDSTVPTPAAMDSAGSHHESGVSPFADSADSSSPPNVSTDHIPLDVLFDSTSGGINDFFLTSDAAEQIGMSRVAVDPDSDDEVLAEILFRGKYISGAGVVVVDKLPDDEIVDPRVKVETVSDYASSPPRSRRKHRGVRSDDFLWDKPVEDFFSSESESDDDMENYIPPLPYGAFKDWEIVRCPLSTTYYHVYYQENRRQKSFIYLKQLLPHVYREDLLLLRRRMNRYFRLNPDVDVGLDLWRDVNLLCQSLHSDDVEDFWRTQDEWIVSSWQLYPKSSVHVLDLTNGKTVYMFVDKVYPIRATLLERMLRHRLTVPPSYCRDVVVAGNIIQTVQDGLRQAYECLASAPIACTARQMVFSSPWLTAKKESGSPLQTALWLVQEGTALGKDLLKSVDGCQVIDPNIVSIVNPLIGGRLDVLFESTSGGINDFFLTSDADEQIGMSRVAVDPDSDDEVLAEILFRGQYISGAGVVVVDKLPDDEIVDPRVKVETVSDYASSPPRSRRKHRGVRSDDFLWDKPVEDFFSSESESDDDMENYIPPLPYGAFKDWEIVRCPLSTTYYHVYYQENRRQKSFIYLKQLLPHVYREDLLLLRRRMNRYFRLNPDVDVGLDLWRDVNLLCQSLHSDDVEDFWRTQDEWIVSSWQLYPKSSVHVLDLTNGKTVYMFVDKVYPIRATLLERMLRHRLTVPPSYCRDVVVAGNIIQTVQDGLRQAYECLASASIACTARQMVFSSPWLTAKKESGSPLQTALVCNSNPLIAEDSNSPLIHVLRKLTGIVVTPDWKACCYFDDATSFDVCLFIEFLLFLLMLLVLMLRFPVSAACILAVFINICCILCYCCHSILLLREDLSRTGINGVKTKFRRCFYCLVSFLLTEIESAELYKTINTRGRATDMALPWEDLKKPLMEEYCPDDAIQKLEAKFWNHTMIRSDIDKYTARFHELARQVPHMVTLESKHINRYIQGLAPKINRNVTSFRPTTIQSVVSMVNPLTNDAIKDGIFKKDSAGSKRKHEDQSRNWGRNNKDKKQRTGINFDVAALGQG
ncbi:xylulose kinase-1 [Tanacetum coccineum]